MKRRRPSPRPSPGGRGSNVTSDRPRATRSCAMNAKQPLETPNNVAPHVPGRVTYPVLARRPPDEGDMASFAQAGATRADDAEQGNLVMQTTHRSFEHPNFSRRTALQAGTVGLLGLGMNHLAALRAGSASTANAPAKSVIYIFLSGGLSQHDSFDMKPEATANVRGEFEPISTATPGFQICEHLPLLAERSNKWAVVRSLTHPNNEHLQANSIMLSGRTMLPPGFNPTKAQPTDWPSMAAVAGAVTAPRNNLPPAVILPEALRTAPTKFVPGQLAGMMGARRDPWIISASPYRAKSWGAYPTHAFEHHDEKWLDDQSPFAAPNLSLPEGLNPGRLDRRFGLLDNVESQRRDLQAGAAGAGLDRYRQAAISLLADPKVKWAFDVTHADGKTQDRYGRNSFGWSLLMARRLVESGVNLVQVNLGNNITWDTHGSNFFKLKDFLLPPTDRALSALLDDLDESGLLDETLIVMAGEFGRTPKISQCCPTIYTLPGRDHWGAAQSVFFAGGGVKGGNVIGATDRIGAWPTADPQTPENMAATIYEALGIPREGHWSDELNRPYHVYHGAPIVGLT